MRPRDTRLAQELQENLTAFSRDVCELPGIRSSVRRSAFLEQILESIRRVQYVSVILTRDISDQRAVPSSELFDPLKAAVLRLRQNQIDEACWLVFFFVHFGKHRRTGWRLSRDVYGALNGTPWHWNRVSRNPAEFRGWLHEHQQTLRATGHFGNHRKYQSLDAYSTPGTGAAVESYVNWIRAAQNHGHLFQLAVAESNGDARQAFDRLYDSMSAVMSFGRTAKFDYLAMIGKLQIGRIEPGSAYLTGSTGPIAGAKLLFGDNRSNAATLDGRLVQLGAALNVGMQVIEDSLCNWQKSPDRFVPFRS